MNFRERLSTRMQIRDVREIIFLIQDNNKQKQELFNLIFESDDVVAYQSAWVFTHVPFCDNEWLFKKQDKLINEVFVCPHPGKRRLILNIILDQPMQNPPRVDFLDFCIERMISRDELPGVQSLCMKLAFEQCKNIPDLLHELRSMLEIIDTESLPISMKTVRKNILKTMKKGRVVSK